MTDDGLTPTQRAFLQSQYHREAFEDMSAADINRLDMATYARLSGRQPLGQVAAEAVEALPQGTPRAEPAPAQTPPQAAAPGPQGVDVASLDMQQYAQLRGQLGTGRSQQEGKGIFDPVGSRSETYTAAVRAQAGRTGWTTSNVVESPRLERRYARQDEPDSRPAAERFSTPGNAFTT